MRFCALYLPNLCQENVVFNFDLTQTVMEISLFLFKKNILPPISFLQTT
jgi:hypothetical protein